MQRRVSGLALAMASIVTLALPFAWGAEAQTAPAKTPLSVTYYFLPG